MGLDFFRHAAWLDATRVRGYLRIVALLNIATLIFLVATSGNGIDRNGFLIGTDFLSFWTAGQMLQAHMNVYDAAAHAAAQRAYFAQTGVYTAFFYPPPFLLLCWPLGLLRYFPALALWLGLTGAAYCTALWQWIKRTGLAQPLLVPLVAFPPVLITVTHGQTSFLMGALLGLGALLVRDRPWLAGALLGLAVIKPQFGLLVPVVLLVTREWRAIGGALVAAALAGMTANIAFGAQAWRDWFEISRAAQTAMSEGAVDYAKMQSPFAAAMLVGAPLDWASALQAGVTATVMGALIWASWGRRYDLSLGALMLAGAPLATPFVLDYDMVLLGFPLIWLAAQGFGPWEKLIFAATFIAPAFARPLAVELGIPIMPFVLAAFFVVLLRRVMGRGALESARGQ